MNIKQLLEKIAGMEYRIDRLTRAQNNINSSRGGKITDLEGSYGEAISADLLLPILGKQIDEAQEKLAKLKDAKETAERVIKGLLND